MAELTDQLGLGKDSGAGARPPPGTSGGHRAQGYFFWAVVLRGRSPFLFLFSSLGEKPVSAVAVGGGVSALWGQPDGAGVGHGRLGSLLSSCLQQTKSRCKWSKRGRHPVVSLRFNREF